MLLPVEVPGSILRCIHCGKSNDIYDKEEDIALDDDDDDDLELSDDDDDTYKNLGLEEGSHNNIIPINFAKKLNKAKLARR